MADSDERAALPDAWPRAGLGQHGDQPGRPVRRVGRGVHAAEGDSPHPYSRETTLTGTRGTIEVDNARVYLESLGHNNHTWRTGSAYNSILAQHDHWLWPALVELAEQYGGHGGGDFVSIFRLIQLMRLGMTPDIDVYDSAAWCSVIPLSHESMKTPQLRPVKVPDFTRGYWKAARPTFDRPRPDDPWLEQR